MALLRGNEGKLHDFTYCGSFEDRREPLQYCYSAGHGQNPN